jgi:hypothetical protein
VELGELIDVPIPEQDLDPECPFSHEKPNPNEKNELGGIGSKLGTNLAGEVGVHTSKPPRGGNYTRFKKVPDPREPPRALTHVYVFVNGRQVELDGAPLPYPLTCAAHHLIPAQEALKGHPVLKFMCKEGETQDFRNSGGAAPDTVPGALVWGNVAYNVNGGQNGVWLPGNYAVGAGVGGVEVWKSRASDQRATFSAAEAGSNWESAVDLAADTWAQLSTDPQEEEGPQPGVSLATALASASIPSGATSSPRWTKPKASSTIATPTTAVR